MEICPNCCEELEKKKYNHSNRLKCTNCGYETSNWEIEKETEEFNERLREQRRELYRDNENFD